MKYKKLKNKNNKIAVKKQTKKNKRIKQKNKKFKKTNQKNLNNAIKQIYNTTQAIKRRIKKRYNNYSITIFF